MLAFNAAIMTTDGKLDQPDIDSIDGDAERLHPHLIQRYERTVAHAASRVESFRAVLSARPQIDDVPIDIGVRA